MPFTSTQMALKAHYEDAARTLFNKNLGSLNPYELNNVIAKVVKEHVIPKNWNRSRNLYSRKRITVYFSAEFLNGRIVLDHLNNAGLLKATAKIFKRASMCKLSRGYYGICEYYSIRSVGFVLCFNRFSVPEHTD